MISNLQGWQRQTPALDQTISDSVSKMLLEIEQQGDAAINQYAEKFDNQAPQIVELKDFDEYELSPELAEAIKVAAARIERFANFQLEGVESRFFEDEYGFYGQVVTPLQRVGAYIPGGRYPLISTALMTLLPAKAAGNPYRIACSPSNNPAILAAASLAGATQFIQLGGVQAIGALAFGYNDIAPVDLIVGPGNAWVNEAKKQLQSKVKIDGLAGPSELLAICDGNQPFEWIALDALAQAEHDPMAQSIIVSDDKNWLNEMLVYLQKKEDTKALLANKQIELVEVNSKAQAIAFSEDYAPEHLMLCHEKISEQDLNHYGSLFLGANSAVALGDYISGPNHTLPTLGFAKQNGGLSVNNYLKIATVQEVNNFGRKILSEQAERIADAEGLIYHAQSLRIRRKT